MIINAGNLALTNDTGKVLLGSQSFGNFISSRASFTAIDSFTTKLRLFNDNILLDSIPAAAVLPGKSYSIYAIGVLNATGDKRPRLIMHEHQ